MSIQAGIKTPGIYTDININTQRTGLPANTQKVLFITTDTAVTEIAAPVDVYAQSDADTKFGTDSVMGRMIKAAVKTNRLVDVQGISQKLNNGEIPPISIISCAGAIQEAKLTGFNVIGLGVTVDVYVNGTLIAVDVEATYINQKWLQLQALANNAIALGYSVSGTSSNEEIFYNSSASNITFEFVPKSDALYGGTTYYAKDALQIASSNNNPTVAKDPVTGVVSFCLAGNG